MTGIGSLVAGRHRFPIYPMLRNGWQPIHMENLEISTDKNLGQIEMMIARSDFLDTFSDLEADVVEFLRQAKQSAKGPHFGAKVEAFRSIEGISRIAKTNYPTRDKLADSITALLPIRADIVHSRMTVCTLDGHPAARFVNSQNLAEPYPLSRLLTLQDMQKLCQEVSRIVDGLANLGRTTNPASSPQPPSQAATTDP